MYKAQFQQPNGVWLTREIDGNEYITAHLQAKEIWNNSCVLTIKLKMYQNSVHNSWLAVNGFECIRGRYGKPISLSCGYREESYNKSVGGVDNSLHLFAEAFDCQVGKVSDAEFQRWVGWCEVFCAINSCQGECGRYNWGIHIGFTPKLPYTFNGLVYTFDKR